MTGSVRARLTVAAVVVVGAIAVTAAIFAPRSVERALVDDRLDAEVSAERAAFDGGLVTIADDGGSLGSPQLTALFGPDIAGLAASLDEAGALDRLRSFRGDGTLVVIPIPGVIGEIGADGQVRVDDGLPTEVRGPVITGQRLEQLSNVLGPPTLFEFPADIFSGGSSSLDDFFAELQERFDEDLGPRLDLGELGDFGEFGDLEALAEELFSDDLLGELDRSLLDDLPLPAVGTDPDQSPRTIDQFVFGTRDVDGVEVIVAASADGIERTVERLRDAIWVGVPIAMLLTGLATWLLAGRALRPVRAITEQTGRIRTGTLHERVPVPASHDEISALAGEMNDMLDRLHHDDRRRRQFVADASHELRSPIASIHTQAEVALAHAADGATQELAAGVLAEAERLGTIVDDLLALARHDEALAPPGGVVDLDDMVIGAALRPRRVPVDTSRVSGGQVRGRPDELTRCVTHLLDNAARHAASTVRVSLVTIGDRVELAVDDDGPGVEPADRERIFERFVRLDEARVRDDGGAGLGLSVVSTVVTAAGGSVAITESELGGARFVATFPTAT